MCITKGFIIFGDASLSTADFYTAAREPLFGRSLLAFTWDFMGKTLDLLFKIQGYEAQSFVSQMRNFPRDFMGKTLDLGI